MTYLFDTDAISETLKPHPLESYVSWLGTIPRAEQFTSAVVVGEMYKGAYRSASPEAWIERIEQLLLPSVTVLPYDAAVAKVYGKIRARLERARGLPGEADIQIAATAIHHGLRIVTGNIRHYARIERASVEPVLSRARSARRRRS